MTAATVYIAEVIWFEENPVDGRDRIAVTTSLDSALASLRTHEIFGGDLVATETTSALGTDKARTWAVHERGMEADDEGHLWITSEPLTPEESQRTSSTDRPGDSQHTGGNAEDCPVCRPLIDQPGGVLYPWHCTAADTEHREETTHG